MPIIAAYAQPISPNETQVGLPPAAREQVTALVLQPEIKRALKFLKSQNDRNVRELIELTEIPAPPFGEAKRANRFRQILLSSGLEHVHIDEVGNVIGQRKGSVGGRTVALVAHLDTVFPPDTDVKVRREGNTYFAPGVGDNSRGLVVLLSVARALQSLNIQTQANLMFVGSVGEEGLGDLRGVRHLFDSNAPKIDSLIAIDGGSNARIVHSAVGSIRYRVTVQGQGGHSWGAFGHANPHHSLARAVTRFAEQAAKLTTGKPKASYNVGRMGGGTSINSIPAQSWMEVDMRSGDPEKLDALDRLLHASVKAAVDQENRQRTGGMPLSVEMKAVGNRPAGKTVATAELVITAIAALRFLGIEARLTQSSTDANIPMSLGIPAITLSRGGRSSKAHSPQESWENIDAHLALQAAFLTLLADAGYVAQQ